MLEKLITESRNPASEKLDSLSSLELVRLMNSEDAKVAEAVAREEEPLARAIEVTAARLGQGGRLIYFGAGTSGRLGVLDAAECPPTFRSDPGQVVGIIAGGHGALLKAVEGAEDDPNLAEQDMRRIDVGPLDVCVGIATSGRTPYVMGGLRYARSCGAYTVALSCNAGAEIASEADLAITPVVGPEVVSGSTRLKAGTATKLVLNTLSTGAMIMLGKTYGNLMVDLQATNTKLTARATRIVREITGLESDACLKQLEACEWEVKTAIVAWHANVGPDDARKLLAANGGHIARSIESIDGGTPIAPAAPKTDAANNGAGNGAASH
ncbi:N-acetylmuramic acid 6-phosphate etherase [Posidoniimonas polymericola]|uniref:N-acetylmuramic acid 6-phosphate etherase n=1 Tax=Posidoniimonas polymericola TaxID=2528002 RepID=A0A5C5YTV3_9BACT|nr:N-acetylmuramic acid 6-phosphate etherase [Posidoniimonas polymericola]TWT78442.1 N-acetylmuramic acid 6-phosphate etherase [Posidoniimonas polymericola]